MDPHLRLLHQCCGSLLWIPSPSGKWASQVTANYAMARQDHPEWSKLRCLWDATQETVHTALDVAGMAPGLGEVFDVANGILYTIQGDGLNATLSYAAAVPLVGWASTSAKWAKKAIALNGSKRALKWTKDALGKISFGDRQLLRKMLGLPVGDIREAHHLIPWELGEHDLVQEAAKGVDELLNGIPLEFIQHNGSHAMYTTLVRNQMESIQKVLQAANNFNPTSARKALEDLINNVIRPAIVNNPNTPINQLIF